MLCTRHTKCLFGTVSQQNPNQVVLSKFLIACIGPRGQAISWHPHVMPMQRGLNVIVQLCWTCMIVRTGRQMGRAWRYHREKGNINVESPLHWQHYWDVWFKVSCCLSTNYFFRNYFFSISLTEIRIFMLPLIRSVMTDIFVTTVAKGERLL